MRYIIFLLFTCFLLACNSPENTKINKRSADNPNIVMIYLDDLGYGDVSAYGATEIHTPNMDMLANAGVKFTDGYAASATCSPSRYALLTGRYPWRNKRARILPGTAPLLIDTAEMTIPKMLKKEGYHTGIVGKWHLGLGHGNVNWNEHISPGPNEVGFDYSYIMAATQDRVPTVYIENGRVVRSDPSDPIQISYKENFPGEPTGKENLDDLKMMWDHGHNNSIVNGIPRIGFMKGGEEAKWVDENMADTFLVRAQNYIEAHKEEPFFLYYAMQQPHVPRTPHPRFVGKSGMGPRGDVILEADWCIGQLIEKLDKEGLLENTMIIMTSDNGPVLNDGYVDYAVEKIGDHTPSGPLRGGKYSLFEAGTRVPFMVYWKGKTKQVESTALVSQIDLFSSLAQLVGSDLRGPDSKAMADVFLGKDHKGREKLILEATGRTALRKGNWVMIPPYQGPAVNSYVNIELGNMKEIGLFNLNEDIGQQENLAADNPDKLKEMADLYRSIRGEDHLDLEKLQLKR